MDVTSRRTPSPREGERPRAAEAFAPGPALDAEALDLVRRAAALPRGLALLHRAPIDAAAAALGVHAAAVDRARAALEHPRARAEAVEAFAAAAGPRQRPPLGAASRSPLSREGEGEGEAPYPPAVVLCECWARDGLQSVPVLVPTAQKVEMIDRVTAAGFQKVEVTSFSHPKLLPQFADAAEVLRAIRRRPGVSHVVLVPNERGFDRLERCQGEGHGAEEIILMISSSAAHNQLNFRMPHADAMREHERVMRRAHALGMGIIGCAGTVYGCPVSGDVPFGDVARVVRFYLDHGARTIMLGDTTGMANPVLVRERIGELRAAFPRAELIAHFHDTRGTGVVNTITALELGVRYVDTSLGAIGGQPATGAAKYSAGFTGNTCTEDLVAVLEEMGVRTGVDVERLLDAGRRAEEILGQRLRSNVLRSGPVLHAASSPEKEPGAAASATTQA